MLTCQRCGACFDDGYDLCGYDGGTLAQPFTGTRVLGDRYLLEQRLAEGAMGVVFRATHLQVGSTVAVKLMQPQSDSVQVAVARFHREAQILGQVKHPNAVLVMDFGVEDRKQHQVPYLVMEFLRGETLEQVMQRQGRLNLEEVERIFPALCGAVEEAHQVGVVHRDIKPANIFLERLRDGSPVVKVVDFGIARFVELSDRALRQMALKGTQHTLHGPEQSSNDLMDEVFQVRGAEVGTLNVRRRSPGEVQSWNDSITEAGFMVGTLQYMAPEQVTGDRVSRQTDVYALGTLLFQLLSGQLPFDGDDDAVIDFKLSGERPKLQDVGVHVPEVLDSMLQRCFSLEPAGRPASVMEISQAVVAAARSAREPPKTLPLQPLLATLSALAQALEHGPSMDSESQYALARDAVLAVDAAFARLRSTLDVVALPVVAAVPGNQVTALDECVRRVTHAVGGLHAASSGGQEYQGYLAALWARLASALQVVLQTFKSATPARMQRHRTADKDLFSSAGPLDVGALETVASQLQGKDALDGAEAMEAALGLHLEAVRDVLAHARTQPDATATQLAQGFWHQADALLLAETYPLDRAPRLLGLLASLPGTPVSQKFKMLASLLASPKPDLALVENAAGDARVLWRCLLIHPSPLVRAHARSKLSISDFWPVAVHGGTPLELVREVFEHSLKDATPEYLKVFFLCVRENVEAAREARDMVEALRLLQCCFSVSCFHEDVVFEPLLRLDQGLRKRAAAEGINLPSMASYEEALADFSAGGIQESLPPTGMLSIPLPIQRRLAREGHFLHYFVAHVNERVARETLPHLMRQEDITRFLRIPTIHRAVLHEVSRVRRFFRQEGARLALLQNPRTPGAVARQFLPFIPSDQLRLLAANRHIGAEVRQLAAGLVDRMAPRR